jgi:hypothetical protein
MSPQADVPRASSSRSTAIAAVLLILTTAMYALEQLGGHGAVPEAIGASLVPILILGIALGIASLRDRWKPGRPRVAVWTTAVLFVLTCGKFATRPAENQKARAATMSQLQIDSMTIRHEGLGFELPHPGRGFVLDSSRRAEIDTAARGMLVWIFRHDTPPEGLTITVADSLQGTEVEFRRFGTGVRKAGRNAGARIVEDTLFWGDTMAELRFSYIVDDEARHMRCITSPVRGRPARIVCAITASFGPDSLAFVRRGLRLTKR